MVCKWKFYFSYSNLKFYPKRRRSHRTAVIETGKLDRAIRGSLSQPVTIPLLAVKSPLLGSGRQHASGGTRRERQPGSPRGGYVPDLLHRPWELEWLFLVLWTFRSFIQSARREGWLVYSSMVTCVLPFSRYMYLIMEFFISFILLFFILLYIYSLFYN